MKCKCACHLPENDNVIDYHFDGDCGCKRCYGCGQYIKLFTLTTHYEQCTLFKEWKSKQKRKYLRELGVIK